MTPAKIPVRVYDYIEARLLSPCDPALEAYDRLRSEAPAEAAELMAAMTAFTDATRAIRRRLADRQAGRSPEPPARPSPMPQMARPADPPSYDLSDACERVLIALAAAADWPVRTAYHVDGWHPLDAVCAAAGLPRLDSRQIIRLEELGLAETDAYIRNPSWGKRGTGCRITAAGLALCHSMGD